MKSLKNDISLIIRGLKEIHEIRRGILGLLLFRAVFNALTPFVNIYMSALIIDGIAAKAGLKPLLLYAAITITLNLLILLIVRILNRFINLRQFEFNERYEMKFSRKLIAMDYTTIEDPQTHRLREKINEFRSMDRGGIMRLFDSFQSLIKSFFTVIFSVSLTVSLFTTVGGKKLTGLFAVVASPVFSVILVFGIIANVFISMYANNAGTKKMYILVNGFISFNRIFGYYFNDYISSYHAGKDIRVYNQKGLIDEEFMSMFDDLYIVFGKLSKNQRKYLNIVTTSTILLSTLIYLFVGLKALAGLFGVGSVVRYVGSINEFTNGFTDIMTQITKLRANNEAMQVYFDYMDIPSQMYQGSLTVEKRSDRNYEVEFRDVSFKYPNSDIWALHHVSTKFRIGERLAVVGQNGSGKTTFIKLLCRLYDPTEGDILLNGINIKKYDYKEYMSIFSVVFQDFKLFSFSLGQNVAASVKYDEDRVLDCCREAGIDVSSELRIQKSEAEEKNPGSEDKSSDIGVKSSKENGEKAKPHLTPETCLYKDFDEKGVEISGGEAQKIAIARALYKDAPFIILDEPTAALDPIAEYEIYSKFNEIVGDKTAIYISHRLSSCRFCDDIAVFDNGRIVQRGSHDELVTDENGKYHELWFAQAQYYAENKEKEEVKV